LNCLCQSKALNFFAAYSTQANVSSTNITLALLPTYTQNLMRIRCPRSLSFIAPPTVYSGHVLLGNELSIRSVAHVDASWNMSKMYSGTRVCLTQQPSDTPHNSGELDCRTMHTQCNTVACLYFWWNFHYRNINDDYKTFYNFFFSFMFQSFKTWNLKSTNSATDMTGSTGWHRETVKFEIIRKKRRKLTKLYLILKMCSTRMEISLDITF
jgi:hypothetical protein